MNVFLQFARFVGVGGLGLALHLAITYVFTEFVGVWYFWSYLIATCCSWTLMFFANSHFTFEGHDQENYAGKYLRFIGIYVAAFVVNAGLVYTLTSWWGVQYLLSIIIATIITTSITFLGSKVYVFYYTTHSDSEQ